MIKGKNFNIAMAKIRGSLLEEIMEAMTTDPDLSSLGEYPGSENQDLKRESLGEMSESEKVLFGLRSQRIKLDKEIELKLKKLLVDSSQSRKPRGKLVLKRKLNSSKLEELDNMFWESIRRRLKEFSASLSINKKGEIVVS